MATATSSGLLWYLRQSDFRAEGFPRSDGELLHRFRTERDEAAFAALVRRHGPMVYGVCRRTLRNDTDAEDAFQATFLVLARRAHSINPPGRVGHWLYGVAYNTARKARMMHRRRLARERRAGIDRLPDDGTRHHPEWHEALDIEISRLPDKFRDAVVLCDLEGESLKEAARRLECPTGTVASRLARARMILRNKLARRGLVLATLIAPGVVNASVPSRLAIQTTHGAFGFAPISNAVLKLTEGVIQAMFLSKVKFVFAMVAAAGILVAGLGNGSSLIGADSEKPTKPGADPVKPVKPGAEPAKPGEKPIKPGADPAKPEKPIADSVKPGKPDAVKTPGISGTIKSINTSKNSLVISLPSKDGTAREETVATDKETKFTVDGKTATLADLKLGQPVNVKLTADRTKALAVSVEGKAFVGKIKSIDQDKKSMTIMVTTYPDPKDKSKTATEEKTLKIADSVKIAVEGMKKATIEDIKVGSSVQIHLSADGERILAIMSPAKIGLGTEGTTVVGELKEIASDKKSLKIVVMVKDKNDPKTVKTIEKSITLSEKVRFVVDGNKEAALGDLRMGTSIMVQLAKGSEQAVLIVSPAKAGAPSNGEKKPLKPGAADPTKKPVKPGADPVKPNTDKAVKGEKPVK